MWGDTLGNFGYIFGYSIIFTLLLGNVIGYIIGFYLGSKEDKDDELDNEEDILDKKITSDKCYENGELNNICTIIALKNLKREIGHLITNMETDAIDKAIKNTLSVEKLNIFINCKGDVE